LVALNFFSTLFSAMFALRVYFPFSKKGKFVNVYANRRLQSFINPVQRTGSTLIAVMVQGHRDTRCIGWLENARSTQVAATLLAQANIQVACSSPAVLHLAIGCEAETLFRTLMGFEFWHD
jgi:hypothetical protein